MKTLIMIATLITSTLATATSLMPTPGLLEFSVVKANFSASHVSNPSHASVNLNYNEGTVTLQIDQKNNCPPNAMCILSMPMPVIVHLPIVHIKTDSCGIKTVIAKTDMRPVDGGLEVLIVKDVTFNVCDVNFAPTATYKTEYYNRMGGKNIVSISTMVLQQYMTALAE